MMEALNEFNLQSLTTSQGVSLLVLVATSTLQLDILKVQKHDQELDFHKYRLDSGKALAGWTIHADGRFTQKKKCRWKFKISR